METGGYDIVAEVYERFADRALAAAFYRSAFPEIKGSYMPPNVPQSMGAYAGIDYEVVLKEPPTIDVVADPSSQGGRKVRVLFNLKACLKVLGGLRLEFDVAASVEATPSYDQSTRVLFIDLKGARIDELKIDDKYGLSADALDHVNKAISAAIRSDLLDAMSRMPITPVIYSLDLPYMPPGPLNQLTIGLGNVKLPTLRVIAGAVNLLGYTGGNIDQVTDFTSNLDLAVGISEAGMRRVYNFWWDRTTWPKSVEEKGEADIEQVEDLLNAVSGFFNLATEVSTAIATLGIVIVDQSIVVHRAWIEYGATIDFRGKPSFDLLDGNRIELTNCPLHIHAWATPKLDVETIMSVRVVGIEVKEERDRRTYTVPTLSTDLDITVDRARAKVELLPQNQLNPQTGLMEVVHRLVVTIEEVDVTIELPWSLPQAVLNTVIDWIEGLIKDRFPPIVLFPDLLFTQWVQEMNLTLEVDVGKLVTNTDELIAGVNIKFKELPEKIDGVPVFIANKDLKAHEVHRAACPLVKAIPEKNKVGYYSLYDALYHNYKGCKDCLPEYH
jgi:hypothetical protein